MVVVQKNHEVHNRIVRLDEMISAGEPRIDSELCQSGIFSGWTLEAVRRELAGAAATRKRRLRRDFCAKLTLLFSKGLLDFDASPEVHAEGASNLRAWICTSRGKKCVNCSAL